MKQTGYKRIYLLKFFEKLKVIFMKKRKSCRYFVLWKTKKRTLKTTIVLSQQR